MKSILLSLLAAGLFPLTALAHAGPHRLSEGGVFHHLPAPLLVASIAILVASLLVLAFSVFSGRGPEA